MHRQTIIAAKEGWGGGRGQVSLCDALSHEYTWYPVTRVKLKLQFSWSWDSALKIQSYLESIWCRHWTSRPGWLSGCCLCWTGRVHDANVSLWKHAEGVTSQSVSLMAKPSKHCMANMSCHACNVPRRRGTHPSHRWTSAFVQSVNSRPPGKLWGVTTGRCRSQT